MTGLDVQLPSLKVQQQIKEEQSQQSIQPDRASVSVDFVESSVENIPFEDGYFDAIVCCLTLCSVNDPERAVQEMQRVLSPRGGALGYVEHVAADGGFLEWQQRVLDPVQQTVADNCHLHRATQDVISTGMGVRSNRAKVLSEERFLVDAMWPVSMQSCGVVHRT